MRGRRRNSMHFEVKVEENEVEVGEVEEYRTRRHQRAKQEEPGQVHEPAYWSCRSIWRLPPWPPGALKTTCMQRPLLCEVPLSRKASRKAACNEGGGIGRLSK